MTKPEKILISKCAVLTSNRGLFRFGLWNNLPDIVWLDFTRADASAVQRVYGGPGRPW